MGEILEVVLAKAGVNPTTRTCYQTLSNHLVKDGVASRPVCGEDALPLLVQGKLVGALHVQTNKPFQRLLL